MVDATAYRYEPQLSETGYVECLGIRIEPGIPELHPYQDALDWLATGHIALPWAFAGPRPARPTRGNVAILLARAIGAIARAAWMFAVLILYRIPADLTERRAARLGRPMKPMLISDYRGKARRRTVFLVYAIVVTAVLCRPYFLQAYQDIATHVHAAANALSRAKP